MRSTLAVSAAAAVLILSTGAVRAQSLTPIHGWVPWHSAEAKALLHGDTVPAAPGGAAPAADAPAHGSAGH